MLFFGSQKVLRNEKKLKNNFLIFGFAIKLINHESKTIFPNDYVFKSISHYLKYLPIVSCSRRYFSQSFRVI